MKRKYEQRSYFFLLEAKTVESDASENTIKSYKHDLTRYFDWISSCKVEIFDAELSHIELYLVNLKDCGLSIGSRARHFISNQTILSICRRRRVGLRANPALQISSPGRSKKLPQSVTLEVIERLLRAAGEEAKNKSLRARNICLMTLLYATGMRVSEMMSLPLDAVKGNPNMVLVSGKGSKERLVPLSKLARSSIKIWIEERKILLNQHKHRIIPLILNIYFHPIEKVVIYSSMVI